MKLAQFLSSGISSYGILDDDCVVSLPDLAKILGEPFPSSLEMFISQGKIEKDIEQLLEGWQNMRLRGQHIRWRI